VELEKHSRRKQRQARSELVLQQLQWSNDLLPSWSVLPTFGLPFVHLSNDLFNHHRGAGFLLSILCPKKHFLAYSQTPPITEPKRSPRFHSAARPQPKRMTQQKCNAEGVRQFEPRVELWQPWDIEVPVFDQTPKGFANAANPFRVARPSPTDPRVAKAQPWAEIGQHLRCKKIWSGKQKVVGLLHRVTTHAETTQNF